MRGIVIASVLAWPQSRTLDQNRRGKKQKNMRTKEQTDGLRHSPPRPGEQAPDGCNSASSLQTADFPACTGA
jgi:hypothetical protein